MKTLLKLIILAVLTVVIYRKIKTKKLTWGTAKSKEQSIFIKLNQKIKAFLAKKEDNRISRNLPLHRALIQSDEEIVMEWEPYRFANFYANLIVVLLWVVLILILFEMIIISTSLYYMDGFLEVIETIVSTVLTSLVIFGVAQLLIFLIFLIHIWIRGNEYLVITSKRVCYRYLDHQLSLPLDCVCSSGTNPFHMLMVSTPSGAIRVRWVRNYMQMHQQLINILIGRQSAAKAVPAETPVETKTPESPVPTEEPVSEPEKAQEPEGVPVAKPEIAPEPVPASKPVAQVERTPEPAKEEPDPFAPLPKSTAVTPQGMRIGRCVMCRRVELPVKTVPVLVAGVERRRTLCEKCAQKHAIQ